LKLNPLQSITSRHFLLFTDRQNIYWLIYLAVLFLLWIHAPVACMGCLYDTAGGVKAQKMEDDLGDGLSC